MQRYTIITACALLAASSLAQTATSPAPLRTVRQSDIRQCDPNLYIVPRRSHTRSPAVRPNADGGTPVAIGGEPIRDAADLQAKWALAHDDTGLTVLIEIGDDQLVTRDGANLWEGDSIQLVIDQGLERTDYYDDNDLEIGFALDAAGQPQSWCWQLNRPLSNDECICRVSRTADGYRLLAHLNWRFLHRVDRTGRRAFGFNFIVNDNDGGGRKGWLELRPGIGAYKSSRHNLVAVLQADQPTALLLTEKTCADQIAGSAVLCFAHALTGKTLRLTATDPAGATVELIPTQTLAIDRGQIAFAHFNADPQHLQWGPLTLRCAVDGQTLAEASAENLPLRRRIESLHQTAQRLQPKIDALAEQGKPTRYAQALLAVLETQTRFAQEDLNHPDAAASTFFLEKAIRRLRELSEVAQRLDAMVDALAAAEKLDRFKTFTYVTSPIELRDGFYHATTVDDAGNRSVRPVIFNGYLRLFEHGTRLPPQRLDDLFALFRAMGNNAVQYAGFGPYAWSYDNQHKIIDVDQNGQFVYDPAVVAGERVAGTLALAAKNDIAVDLHLSVENVYPHEITGPYRLPYMDSGFLRYQFDDPRARDMVQLYLQSVVTDLRQLPGAEAIASFCLINEPIYIDKDIASGFHHTRFRDYLKRRYHNDISALNRAYGTKLASFDEVTNLLPTRPLGYQSAFSVEKDPVLAFDWHRYKSALFADWIAWMSDIVHDAWPAARTHTKMMVFKAFIHGERYNNVDPERFTLATDLNGNDNYFMYPGGHVFHAPGYAVDWLSTALYYDLQTSLKHTVVVNTENHIIHDQEKRDVPYDHVYTALFQQFTHGLGFSANWAWVDQGPGGYASLYGLFPERPIAAAAAGQVTLDANRLARQIKAFFDQPADLAILYSPTSYLYNPAYGQTAADLYHALNFLGRKIAFISERQIADGDFADLKLILAPNASHVLPQTVEKLRAWQSAAPNRQIISIGASFAKDDFNRELPNPLRCPALAPNADHQTLAAALKSILDDTLNPLPIQVTLADRQYPDGLEWRLVPHNGQFLLNLVNYTHQPQTVELHGAAGPMLDLISYEMFPSRLTLPPLRPLLLQPATH